MSIIIHFEKSDAKINGCKDALIIQDFELKMFRNETELQQLITVRYTFDTKLNLFVYDYANKVERWSHRDEHKFDYEKKFCAVALKQFNINLLRDIELKTGEEMLISYNAGVPNQATGLYENRRVNASLKLVDQRVVYK